MKNEVEKLAIERISRLREQIIEAELALERAKEYRDYDNILFPEMKKLSKKRYNKYMSIALGIKQKERE